MQILVGMNIFTAQLICLRSLRDDFGKQQIYCRMNRAINELLRWQLGVILLKHICTKFQVNTCGERDNNAGKRLMKNDCDDDANVDSARVLQQLVVVRATQEMRL